MGCRKPVYMMDMLCQNCMPNWLTASVVQSIRKLFETDLEKIEKSGLHHQDSDSDHETTKNLQVDQEALEDHDQEDLEDHQELEEHLQEDLEELQLPLLLQLSVVSDKKQIRNFFV